MEIKAEDLKDVCVALRQVPQSASMKTSQFFRVDAEKHNLVFRAQCDVLARFHVPYTGKADFTKFHIERASFLPFVDYGAAGPIAVEMSKGKLVFSQGRRRVAFTDVDAGKYAGFEIPDRTLKLSEEQLHVMRAARAYALDDTGEPRFNCVMLDGVTIMGASHVAFYHCVTGVKTPRVPVSLFICDQIKPGAKLHVTETASALSYTNGAYYHALSATCLKEFPSGVMLKRAEEVAKLKPAFKVKAGKLAEAVRTLQGITSGSVTDDIVLTVKIGADKLVLSAGGQAVNASETVKAETFVDGKEQMLLVSILPFIRFAAEEKPDGYITVRYGDKTGYHFAFDHAALLAARRDVKAK